MSNILYFYQEVQKRKRIDETHDIEIASYGCDFSQVVFLLQNLKTKIEEGFPAEGLFEVGDKLEEAIKLFETKSKEY